MCPEYTRAIHRLTDLLKKEIQLAGAGGDTDAVTWAV